MMVGRLLFFWDVTFSGAMLNFRWIGVEIHPFVWLGTITRPLGIPIISTYCSQPGLYIECRKVFFLITWLRDNEWWYIMGIICLDSPVYRYRKHIFLHGVALTANHSYEEPVLQGWSADFFLVEFFFISKAINISMSMNDLLICHFFSVEKY